MQMWITQRAICAACVVVCAEKHGLLVNRSREAKAQPEAVSLGVSHELWLLLLLLHSLHTWKEISLELQ